MKKRLFCLSLCVILAVALFSGCAATPTGPIETEKLILADIEGDAEIHGTQQALFLSSADGRNKALEKVRGTDELSYPNSIVLKWQNTLEGAADCNSYKVTISENADLSNPKEYETTRPTQSITNLKVGTQYFWCVMAVMGEKTYISPVKSFKTADAAPRNLRLSGVTNARDLGGWKTEDGGKIKQGLLFRCAKLNNDKTGAVTVQEDGIKVMLEDLKIKSEIDLRLPEYAKNHETSALGDSVKYFFIPMKDNTFNIVEDNAAQIVKVFEVLGNEANYPIVFHCSIGTDRTGAVAFLVNALLGVEKEDLFSDYLFSNFAPITNRRDASAAEKYYACISAADGETLAQKTYNYLLNLGVKKEDLDNTVRILKEK